MALISTAPWRRGHADLAWLLVAIPCALAAASLYLLVLNRSLLVAAPDQSLWMTVAITVCGPVLATAVISSLAALIVVRGPRRCFGLGLALAGGALATALILFTQEYATYGLIVAPGSLVGAGVAAWLLYVLGLLIPVPVLLILLLFPDGSPLTWPRRLAVIGALAATALMICEQFADPFPLSTLVRPQVQTLPVTMPVAGRAPATWVISWAYPWATWIHLLIIPIGGASLAWRYLHATGDERRQIQWVGYAAGLAGMGLVAYHLLDLPSPLQSFLSDRTVRSVLSVGGQVVWLLGISILLPTAIGISVFRYRLYEIERVISGTLLVGAMATLVTGVYAAVVALVGAEVGTSQGAALAVLASICVAIAFAPMRAWLQDRIAHLIYGKRATPYRVLADFGERAASGLASEEALPTIARLLAEATDSTQVGVWLRVGGEIKRVASWPSDPAERHVVPMSDGALPPLPGEENVIPIHYQGSLLGALSIGRPWGRGFAPKEDRLLDDLGRQVGPLLHNAQLMEEVRMSRERALWLREDERRRLERDLHDGAQRQLVTASLHLGSARRLASGLGSSELESRLNQAAQQMAAGIEEVRQLAQGLGPTSLGPADLAETLEMLAHTSPIPTRLECVLPHRCSREVESGAYFFVSEALTNAAKHSEASIVSIRARIQGGRLLIDVTDDGRGGADLAGSGLRGLCERLATVGGNLRLHSPAGQGTVIAAEFALEQP